MDYPYQIKNIDEYNKAYKKSIENPEEFWGEIAENLHGKKSGIKFQIGILKSPI